MADRKLVLIVLGLLVPIGFGCSHRSERPREHRTVGGEVKHAAHKAKEDIDEAADEADDKIDEAKK